MTYDHTLGRPVCNIGPLFTHILAKSALYYTHYHTCIFFCVYSSVFILLRRSQFLFQFLELHRPVPNRVSILVSPLYPSIPEQIRQQESMLHDDVLMKRQKSEVEQCIPLCLHREDM